MTTISEALDAYRIFARAEGKSPKTVEWISCGIIYFTDFLGGDPGIGTITGNDLRLFMRALT